MQELLNLKNDCLNLFTAVENVIAAPSLQGGLDTLRKTITVLSDAEGIAGLFVGPAVMAGTPEAEGVKADIHDCCEKIKARCEAECHRVGEGVGTLGDGTILKEILAALPGILALIQSLLNKPQPAPAA